MFHSQNRQTQICIEKKITSFATFSLIKWWRRKHYQKIIFFISFSIVNFCRARNSKIFNTCRLQTYIYDITISPLAQHNHYFLHTVSQTVRWFLHTVTQKLKKLFLFCFDSHSSMKLLYRVWYATHQKLRVIKIVTLVSCSLWYYSCKALVYWMDDDEEK